MMIKQPIVAVKSDGRGGYTIHYSKLPLAEYERDAIQRLVHRLDKSQSLVSIAVKSI